MPARIFAIIDVWDAITNDRVYRKAMPRDEALQVIEQGRGKYFDPQVVDAFLKMIPEISPATVVQADLSIRTLFEGVNVAQIV